MAHWTDKLKEALFGKSGFLDGEIVVNVPENIYIKDFAIYTCVSLIANAISQCEILVYENGKRVRNENWYSLNIQANVNESASYFWHKVVERMLTAPDGQGALVFVGQNGGLYCADSYNIHEKRPFKIYGNLYDGIVVDDFQMSKTFNAREVMIFKMENWQSNKAVGDLYADLNTLISTAFQHYKDANIQRWKFKIDAREAGSEDFQKEWQNRLKAAVQRYVSGDSKVYVEYVGKVLDPINLAQSASANAAAVTDSVSMIDKTFEMVSKAFHIPAGIVTAGNYNITDLITQFLTFTVDPIADMIGKTITAAYGPEEFAKGNYYKVDTSRIKHFDIFGMASDVDKLISSGFATINEVRRAADWDYAGDPEDSDNWMNQHILTKNYEKGGGRTVEESKDV